MLKRFKKFHWIVIVSLLFLGTGYTLAFAINMTVDGKDDSGVNFGQGAYARFVEASNPSNVFGEVTTATPQFTSADQAIAYAKGLFPPDGEKPWWLLSAGNIWSATDLIVGESLSGLHAGTYRITPTGGGFTYDFWNWSGLSNQYLWKLYILADIDGSSNYFSSTLGSDDLKATAGEAFELVRNQYLDITLAEGGSLYFWIYDVNSVDNAGELSFSVTAVPEPSTLLLLILGLPVLFRRRRN